MKQEAPTSISWSSSPAYLFIQFAVNLSVRMHELLNGCDEFLESLRKECRSQRNILGLSQEKVCRILEEEYGLIKDIPKISQYESGKTRIPDFLPEYCEILKIKFPKVICEKTSQEQEENYMNTPVISNAIKRSQTKKMFWR